MTKALHPLINPELLIDQLMAGQVPDFERGTGRSTILGLQYLVTALKSPGTVVPIKDHAGTSASHRYLAGLMQRMVTQLGLQHVRIDVNSPTPAVAFVRDRAAQHSATPKKPTVMRTGRVGGWPNSPPTVPNWLP